MTRHFDDWIERYVEMVAAEGRSPDQSITIGQQPRCGCRRDMGWSLRRRVWIDEGQFRWYANMYIILDGPPATKKSTAINQVMSILQEVPGVKFGSDCSTWQEFVQQVEDAKDVFAEVGQEHKSILDREHTVTCALTLGISEFGIILQPPSPGDGQRVDRAMGQPIQPCLGQSHQDPRRQCVDEPVRQHRRRHDSPLARRQLQRPVRRMGAFVPDHLRLCRHVPNGTLPIPRNYGPANRARDGRFHVMISSRSPSSKADTSSNRCPRLWHEWYEVHHAPRRDTIAAHSNTDEWLSYYLARKADHVNKLAIVIAASRRDELIITERDIADAIRTMRCHRRRARVGVWRQRPIVPICRPEQEGVEVYPCVDVSAWPVARETCLRIHPQLHASQRGEGSPKPSDFSGLSRHGTRRRRRLVCLRPGWRSLDHRRPPTPAGRSCSVTRGSAVPTITARRLNSRMMLSISRLSGVVREARRTRGISVGIFCIPENRWYMIPRPSGVCAASNPSPPTLPTAILSAPHAAPSIPPSTDDAREWP
jgi:hypothetical protein